jgi:hypothetical protein
MKRILPLLLLAAAAGCASSPYDQPYAEVRVDRVPTVDPLLRPVIINRVDGRTSMEIDRAVMPPGSHKVTLDLPPRQGFHLATQEDLVLDVAPCTRYYVAARLEELRLQAWKPVVRYTEPIGECAAKFKVG